MKHRAILFTAISTVVLLIGVAVSMAQAPYRRADSTYQVRDDIARAASGLAADAARLHQVLRQTEGTSVLTSRADEVRRDANRLAFSTSRFRRHHQIRAHLRELQGDYAQLRAELFDANRTRNLDRASRIWLRVASGYDEVMLAARQPAHDLCAVTSFNIPPRQGTLYD
jgi:hypothetical protein